MDHSPAHLQHCQLNNSIFDLTAFDTGPSRYFERVAVFLQIAEGLALRFERRRQNTHLSGGSDRKDKGHALTSACFALRNPNTLHASRSTRVSSAFESSSISRSQVGMFFVRAVAYDTNVWMPGLQR